MKRRRRIHKKSCRLLLATTAMIMVSSCSFSEPSISITPLHLADGWQISTPEEQGLSSDALVRAFEKASQWSFMYSTLVVRNGFLLAEGYFNGAAVDQARYVASVTKSFLSAMMGIAVHEGFIADMSQKMMSFFPEYDQGNVEPAKFDITLRHLLQMRAGYWHDSNDARWQAWVNSPDWIEYMIRLPLENPPDLAWNYSSGSAHLLSAILTKTTGMKAEDFARQYLFAPLAIELPRWDRDPQGYNYGGWGMYLSPRAMARFGLLYLNRGRYEGQQLIPAAWVDETTTPRSIVTWPSGLIRNLQYASLWWTGQTAVNGQYSLFMAQGHGGQNIVVIPGLNMVVVTTTNPDLSFEDSWTQSVKIFNFIVLDILSAVQ